MISFNENDYNIIAIKKQSKLVNLATKYSYRVYGLVYNEDNPLIHIRYNKFRMKPPRYLSTLRNFLNNNHLFPCIREDEEFDSSKIAIGLRRDLRDHILLSAAVLQTIIYGIEGRINFTKKKIPGIPKFDNNYET